MQRNLKVISGIFLLTIFLNQGLCQEHPGIIKLLDNYDEMADWRLQDPAKLYEGENLYELINGGADIYMQYGFIQALAGEYKKDQKNIQGEIYEMNDTTAARGIFNHINDGGEILNIGDECRQYKYYLMFRKDKYMITITGSDAENCDMESIIKLANLINVKISRM